MLETTELYKQDIVRGTRITNAGIYFGLYDVTAKDDANPSTTDIQPFTDVQAIKDDIRVASEKVGTLEENYFRLDGSFKTASESLIDTYSLGWWSLSQSNASREFETNPTITITFLNLHSSLGIEIFFGNIAYCESFKVTWYYNANIINQTVVENNRKIRCFVDTMVENYNKLVIEIIRTDLPYRFARINEVNYGGEEVFDNNRLISAEIVEEVDPVSSSLSVNKLKFTVHNENQRFNMINPNGIYRLLQKRQQIKAEVNVTLSNGEIESIPMGTYFLSDWKNATGLTATLEATDVIGLLDKTTYYSSPFWINEPILNVLTHILSDAGEFMLNVSAQVLSERVNGYIPVKSHREALMDVLMACRCSMRDGRGGALEVIRANYTSIVKEIGNDLVIGNPVLEQKFLITAVELGEYAYVLSATIEQIHESTFDLNGEKEVIVYFDKAAKNISVSIVGGTIIGEVASSVVAARFTVSGNGLITITIAGNIYLEAIKTVVVKLSELLAGELPQTAILSDNKLVTIENSTNLANYVLNYYQKRVKNTFNFWNDPALEAGDLISVETMFGQNAIGVIERQEIMLSPSIKARLEVVG